MKQPIMRGDIYYAYLKRGIGTEQRGTRPVLYIGNIGVREIEKVDRVLAIAKD